MPSVGYTPDYIDQAFEEPVLNLRKLSGFLRLADEADDLRLRLPQPYSPIPAVADKGVEVGNETVVWHWDRSKIHNARKFQRLLENKMQVLSSCLDYLSDIGAGKWYLVLGPQMLAPHQLPRRKDGSLEESAQSVQKCRRGSPVSN